MSGLWFGLCVVGLSSPVPSGPSSRGGEASGASHLSGAGGRAPISPGGGRRGSRDGAVRCRPPSAGCGANPEDWKHHSEPGGVLFLRLQGRRGFASAARKWGPGQSPKRGFHNPGSR